MVSLCGAEAAMSVRCSARWDRWGEPRIMDMACISALVPNGLGTNGWGIRELRDIPRADALPLQKQRRERVGDDKVVPPFSGSREGRLGHGCGMVLGHGAGEASQHGAAREQAGSGAWVLAWAATVVGLLSLFFFFSFSNSFSISISISIFPLHLGYL